MTFQPSPQQQAIFDAISRGDENLLVDAKAGSGKTTTIVEGTKYIRSESLIAPRVVFLAFNKRIADTLREKLPRTVQSSTFHSLGFRALKDSGIVDRNVKVDSSKCRKILWNAMDNENEDFRNVLRLVGLLKSTVHDFSYEELDPTELIEFHGIDFIDAPKAIHTALRVLKTSSEMTDVIDFDDMLYLAVKYNANFDKQDWVFVDEAQDTNDIQLAILERLFKYTLVPAPSPIPNIEGFKTSSSRLVAVGDPHQAIYGFRGANSDSMSRIAKRFSCKTLPLSVSYRCPKAVVREAQKYLQTI